MSAELGRGVPQSQARATRYAVLVLAPLAAAEEHPDLERAEPTTAAVLEAVARADGSPSTHVVPLRRLVRCGPYGSHRGQQEILAAAALEDASKALGEHASRVVHAVGWEAGVVAAALRQSRPPRADRDTALLVEPLGAPGAPDWSLVDHAAGLVVQSESHRRESLRHGVAASKLHVVRSAAPRSPVGDLWQTPVAGRCLLAVVGDVLDHVALATVEQLLRRNADVHVVLAGTAGRQSRERRCALAMRTWPLRCVQRVHASARVGWDLLGRVDAVVDVSSPGSTPRAALAAMSASRAVLALGQSPAAEVVVGGRTGLVHRGSDPARHAAAILETVADEGVLRQLGYAAHVRWSREHAPDVRARRLTAVYDAVAA